MAFAKLFVIYKRKGRPDPGNYRGISVLSTLAQVYDSIMYSRLLLWYRPKVEQAGAQSGRRCLEQILTIRLVIDTARKKGYTLYIAFIDYRKTYDKVNRSLLLNHLASKGLETDSCKLSGIPYKAQSVSLATKLSSQPWESHKGAQPAAACLPY